MLADCAQGAGKLPLPDADFIAIAAHKIGGPPGFGALLVKDLANLSAIGGQERGYRRGTENLPLAAGLASALALRSFADAMLRLTELRHNLDTQLRQDGGVVVALDADRSNVILISGPSKTADIEMNVVTGVHGPNVVNAFLLR